MQRDASISTSTSVGRADSSEQNLSGSSDTSVTTGVANTSDRHADPHRADSKSPLQNQDSREGNDQRQLLDSLLNPQSSEMLASLIAKMDEGLGGKREEIMSRVMATADGDSDDDGDHGVTHK